MGSLLLALLACAVQTAGQPHRADDRVRLRRAHRPVVLDGNAHVLPALRESLGAERFDAALGSYYRAFPHTGTPTRAFTHWLTDAEPRLRGTILEDWLFTARGIDRLETGESLAAIVESYRRAVR